MSSGQTAISRRAKRRVYGPPHTAYIDAAGGVKDVVRGEVARLLADPIAPVSRSATLDAPRGLIVLRDADYRGLLELCLRLQTAADVRMIIHQEPVARVGELEAALSRAPVDLFLKEGTEVELRVDSVASTVYHEGLIRKVCRESLGRIGSRVVAVEVSDETGHPEVSSANEGSAHAGAKPAANDTGSRQRLTVALLHDTLRMSISLAGEPLWKRGYRVASGAPAPLREDLAAVAVSRSWVGASAPFVLVPFAGTGTFAIEATIRAFGIPPGLLGRRFAFEEFFFGVPKSVEYVVKQLAGRLTGQPLDALLIDQDQSVLDQARRNVAAFSSALEARGTGALVDARFEATDAFDSPWSALVPENGDVYLPLNPPYGRRLSEENVRGLYAAIGKEIAGVARRLAGTGTSGRRGLSGCCLCPNVDTWRIVRSAATDAELQTETLHVGQGGLDIRLLSFRSAREATVTSG